MTDAELTTSVVRGSLWNLAGSVLPILTSLISTPIVLRCLGSESYGVMILIGLVPGYLSFADFGMGVASTRFGSEACGRADSAREREVIWTAALVAVCSALVFAVPMFTFSDWIMQAAQVPSHLLPSASIALRLSSISFVVGIIASVLNTPTLARLRMDLATLATAAPKVILALAAPAVLLMGGGLLGAVSTGVFAAILGLVLTSLFSSHQLEGFFRVRVNTALLKPLITFGGAWVVAGIAAALLLNVEKLILVRLVSVQSLAFYSIASTFASLATLFSLGMTSSLIPAFSRLAGAEKWPAFETLFRRTTRITGVAVLPSLMLLCVSARPIFSIWAGPEFGQHSTPVAYVLIAGLFFNLTAFIPHSTILARGRSELFARLYWVELPLYVLLACLLTSALGILGAALAWSIRAAIDALTVIWLAVRVSGSKINPLPVLAGLTGPAFFLIVPVAIATSGMEGPLLAVASTAGLIAYFIAVWNRFLEPQERFWALASATRLWSRCGHKY